MGSWDLVGRQQELRHIAIALAEPGCQGIVLGGSAGVGKTRLALEALAAQRAGGAVTELARATRAAASVPFGALAHLLPPPNHAEVRTDRLLVLRTLVEAVAQRADGGPFVLAVDDAHLLDDGAATVVHQLAGTGQARVLLTVRTGEVLPDPIVALWREGLCQRLEVGTLTRDDVTDLIEHSLDGPVEQTTLERLWRLSQGNALFLRQLVTEAVQEKHLQVTLGVWTWTGSTAPGPQLGELVEDRIGRLDESSQRALQLLALGEPLELATLVALTDAESVARLEEGAIISTETDDRRRVARLSHPLYGEVVRSRIPAATATALANQLVANADTATSGGSALRLGCWALDFGITVPPGLLGRAASAAIDLAEWDLAHRLAGAAVAEGDERAGLQLAWSLTAQLRPDEAASMLDALQTGVGDDGWRREVAEARIWVQYLGLGRPAEAEAVYRDALAHLVDPSSQDHLRAYWGLMLTFAGRVQEAGAVAIPLLASSDVRVRLRALTPASTSLTMSGRSDDVLTLTDELLTPALERRKELPLAPVWVASARVTALLVAGHLDELEQYLDLIDAASGGGVHSENRAFLDTVRGRIALLRGRPITALRHLTQALAVLDARDFTGRRRWALPLQAEAHALCGDHGRASASWTEAVRATASPSVPRPGTVTADASNATWRVDAPEDARRSPKLPTGLFDLDGARAGAWVLAARGERSRARDVALAVADTSRREGVLASALMASHDALRLGARRNALDRITSVAADLSGWWAPAFVAHATALVDDDGERLHGATDRFEALGATLLAAEAALQAAAAFDRAGLRGRCAAAGARAAQLAGRCEGALTPELADRVGGARLTRREQEVALLVVGGLTNRQVAERLTVSVRTIDNQLQRAYDKLGAHSRGELASILDGQRGAVGMSGSGTGSLEVE